jgi:hypothetical protein
LTGSVFSSSGAARLSATARVVVVVVRAVRASRPGRAIAIARIRAFVVVTVVVIDRIGVVAAVVVVVRIVTDDLCLLATARSTVHVVVGARPIMLVVEGRGNTRGWFRARSVVARGSTGASRAAVRRDSSLGGWSTSM